MLNGSSVVADRPMRPYECLPARAEALEPTGDYPPFYGPVNRFIERSFESGKRFLEHP